MASNNGTSPVHFYTIGGVRVEFPVKAYPSQIAIMDKVIRGLQRGQHCLLESPTGSGKTLALLCATLAWQRAEAERVRTHNEKVDAALQLAEQDRQQRRQAAILANLQQEQQAASVKEEPMTVDVDSDDDFQQPTTKRPKQATEVVTPPELTGSAKKLQTTDPASLEDAVEPNNIDIPGKKRVPRIFFGTRTHKQIAQVIKEFRRTVYCNAPMTVLGSREHTCIHPIVSQSFNKNEGCKELTDFKRRQSGETCSYYVQANQKFRSHSVMQAHGFEGGWDLEDLVKVGRRLRACPYYGSRQLMDGARIVFSPYNYLVDPRIRKSMAINLDGNIVVLDEAHNIEDSAREAASGSFTLEDFKRAMDDCEKVAPHSSNKADLEILASFCSTMATWINRYATSLKSVDLDRDVSTMTGTEFVAHLSNESYGPERLAEIRAVAAKVFADEAESEFAEFYGEEKTEPHLSGSTHMLIEGFLTIMELMLEDNQIHRDDYRVALMRTVERRRNLEQTDGWYTKTSFTSSYTYSLHLWCLNPAVVLKDIRVKTRSIVVSSGTLSPLSSYQSELDVDFKITLEAGHVIPPDRVWVGTISHGPGQTSLNATFHTVNTFKFQDELGKLVLEVCRTVPHGVLCFFTSYGMLEKLSARWQATGLWQQLSSVKTIVSERRESSEFQAMMQEFYSAVNGATGALMLAVCRGKISEGLDFADNNARAVICVGIPFPNVKDTQVELKRAYNDRMSKSKKLLTGSEWYEIQAFRALNQALGRCIRHKKDWGSIILVDDRFSKVNRYVNALSKWVRNSVQHYHDFSHMLSSLKDFTQMRVEEAEEETPEPPAPVQLLPPPTVSSPYFVPAPKSRAVMLEKRSRIYFPKATEVVTLDED